MSNNIPNNVDDNIFYKRFIKLCESRNVKLTPLAKEIGISPGLIKRWELGARVNYDTLLRIANFFDVPLDYFTDTQDQSSDTEYKEHLSENLNVSEEAKALSVAYRCLKNHPSHIVSFVTGDEFSPYDLYRISKYMNCEIGDLIEDQNKAQHFKEIIEKEPEEHKNVISTKDLLITILNSVPGTYEYNYLQFQISRLILFNLMKGKKVSKEMLLNDVGLVNSKVNNLFESLTNNDYKPSYIGFNFSDLMNIYKKLHISYDYMFTGKEYKDEEKDKG